jgi:hypothetical protein
MSDENSKITEAAILELKRGAKKNLLKFSAFCLLMASCLVFILSVVNLASEIAASFVGG